MEIQNFFVNGDSDAEKTRKAIKAWNKIKELTPMEFNKIELVKEPTTLLQSKVGGKPYIPEGMEYPISNVDGLEKKPMKLLAQINFEEMPKIEHFPAKGILQFFLSCQADDDSYGLDSDNQTLQSGFRVIYHPEPKEQLATTVDYSFAEGCFPFYSEASMKFTKNSEALTLVDYRFEEMFFRAYNDFDGEPLVDIFDLPDEIYNRIVEESSGVGHKIGGYPFFTQYDPRELDNEYSNHHVLLFQLDSDHDIGINWGDCGVANFFITHQDLKKLNFSNVMYNWDCC